jgi:PKD repeat protein
MNNPAPGVLPGTQTWNSLGAYWFDVGAYTVKLTDNANGRVIADAINVSYLRQSIRAEFGVDVRSGTAPLMVQFSNSSYASRGTSACTWQWDFGDGTSSTERNPVHVYSAAGVYAVSLTVVDDLGDSDTEVKEALIEVDNLAQLTAQFTSSNRTSSTVNFTDQSSGEITGWEWDFGDGAISSQQNPSHRYNLPGEYAVTLTVYGPGGTEDTEVEERFVYRSVSSIRVDNTMRYKPHFGQMRYGASVILDASRDTIREEDLKYSRLFYSSCVSGKYYLGKLHRGPTFFTTDYTAGENPIPGYLRRYLLGWSDEDLKEWVVNTNAIYDFYNFDLPPPP